VLKYSANVKTGEGLKMKIWGDIPRVSGIYGSSNKIDVSSKVSETASKKDELTISGAAHDFNVTMKALKQVPDIRQDKVDDILQKMDSGNYSVSSSDITEKLLKSVKS
jgi:negative regulator of flagellin synthesis FlgM